MASSRRQLWARIEQHRRVFHQAARENAPDTLSPTRPSWSLLASDGAELLYLWAGEQLHCIHLRQRNPLFRHADNEAGRSLEDEGTFLETFELSPPVPFQVLALRLHPRGQRLALAGIAPDGTAGVAVVDTAIVPGMPSRQSKLDLVRVYAARFACRPSLRVVQLAWHPLSDTHVALLTSDGCFRMFDLAQDSETPEQEFYLQLPPVHAQGRSSLGGTHAAGATSSRVRGSGVASAASPSASPGVATVALLGMRLVDFCFGSSDQTWEMFTVFFLDSSHRVFALCPVVPFGCHIPSEAIMSLWRSPSLRGWASDVSEDSADDDGALEEGAREDAARVWLRITFPSLEKVKAADERAEESGWTEGDVTDGGGAATHPRVWKANGYCFEDRLPQLQECRCVGEAPELASGAPASSLCHLKAGSDWTILATAAEDMSVRVHVLASEVSPRWSPAGPHALVHITPSPANFVKSFSGTAVSPVAAGAAPFQHARDPDDSPAYLDPLSWDQGEEGGGAQGPAVMLVDTIVVAAGSNDAAASSHLVGRAALEGSRLFGGPLPSMLADPGTLGLGPQVFLLHAAGVHCVSLPWVSSLESRLAGVADGSVPSSGAMGREGAEESSGGDGSELSGAPDARLAGEKGCDERPLPMPQASCLLDTRPHSNVTNASNGQRGGRPGRGVRVAGSHGGEDDGVADDEVVMDPVVGAAVVVEWPLGARLVTLTASGDVRVLVPPLVPAFGDEEPLSNDDVSSLEAEWPPPSVRGGGGHGAAGGSGGGDHPDGQEPLSDSYFDEIAHRHTKELTKELCKQPPDVVLPKVPPTARPLLSSSIQGRQFLHESCMALRQKHISHACQMFGGLKALATQMREKVAVQQRTIAKVQGMAKLEQERGERLKNRIDVMADFHKNMVQRLRVLGELDELWPRPLAYEARYAGELLNMERSLPDLENLTKELQRRADQLMETGDASRRGHTPLPESQCAQVFQALEEETRLIEQAKELIAIIEDNIAHVTEN